MESMSSIVLEAWGLSPAGGKLEVGTKGNSHQFQAEEASRALLPSDGKPEKCFQEEGATVLQGSSLTRTYLGSLHILNELECGSVVFIMSFVIMSDANKKKAMQMDPHSAHFLLGPKCNKHRVERRAKRGLNCALVPWEFFTVLRRTHLQWMCVFV